MLEEKDGGSESSADWVYLGRLLKLSVPPNRGYNVSDPHQTIKQSTAKSSPSQVPSERRAHPADYMDVGKETKIYLHILRDSTSGLGHISRVNATLLSR